VISKEVLESMYLTKSVYDIARESGVSRPTVYAWMKRYGIERKTTRMTMKCHFCGKDKIILKKVFELSKRNFCRKGCYTAYMKTPEFREELNKARIEKAQASEVRVKAGLERGC